MTPTKFQTEEIHIVGVGARTPVGLTAPTSAAAMRAGINRIGEHPFMIDKTGEPMMVARAAYLSDGCSIVERFLELAKPALEETLLALRALGSKLGQIPLIVGLPGQRPGLPANLAEQITLYLKDSIHEHAQISSVETISCGNSAGLIAMQEGGQKIHNQNIEFYLAGGVDSYIAPETLEWLDEQEQLHSEQNRWGFAPGEAAGFCLLTSSRSLERYRLRTLGKVLAMATTKEANLIKTDSVCIGEGLTKAYRKILQVLDHPNQKVDQIICDMNGERYRADEYGFTVARTSEYFADASELLAPADCWGDIGAASGPLFCSLAIAAGMRGYAKGLHTLVWTSSESGERSAALLQIQNHQRN